LQENEICSGHAQAWLAVGVLLWSASASAATPIKPDRIVGDLIGAEYIGQPGRPDIPGCTSHLASSVSVQGTSTDFSYQLMRCGDQQILVLERLIEMSGSYPRLRVVDAIILPPFKSDATEFQPKVRQIVGSGDCTLDGSRDREILALVKWGKGNRITSRNGVIAAWGFDLEAGKITRLDTSRIVCEKPTPP
jgi:hypothetical protein